MKLPPGAALVEAEDERLGVTPAGAVTQKQTRTPNKIVREFASFASAPTLLRPPLHHRLRCPSGDRREVQKLRA